MREPGSVSGPQLAVPRPRCAASRWTTVPATGLSSTAWPAAARAVARKGGAGTPAGGVEGEPEPASLVGAELDPADVGVTAVLLRPDIADGLILDGALPATEQAAALAVGIGLVRAGAKPLDPLQPGDRLQDRTDPGQVGEFRRDLDLLLDPHSPIGQRAEALAVADRDSRRAAARGSGDRR